MLSKIAAISALVAGAAAQQVCTLTTETHPSMTWSQCAAGGTCSTVQGSVTIDANWRWLHQTSSSTNCYTGNTWNTTICNSGTTCASACCLDGADYPGTYGASTSGNALTLQFVKKGSYSTNIGSRLYMMASDSAYQEFNLLGNEFTFDVDVSNLPCGLNGALYFVSMDADGGLAKYSGNKAGAKYGTGYCDSQCPRDLKFINGQANIAGWTPSSNDANAGLGNYGSCCSEMDIWEANEISTALTPHPCETVGQEECTLDGCGGTYSSNRYAGECDPDGCDFNPYRMGVTNFYGPGSGFTIDTSKKFTVVTQFLTSGGVLSEIKRFYVQNGVTYANPNSQIAGVTGNSITTDYCNAAKTVFNETSFTDKGGLAQMGKALSSMVLVMSLWDDHYANMLWLDSTYPTSGGQPGDARGTCATTSGVPSDIEASIPNSSVTYSNIKVGPINSTFSATNVVGPGGGSTGGSSSSSSASSASHSSTTTSSSASHVTTTTSATHITTTTTTTTTRTSSASGAGQTHWGQCGGIGWTGPTSCQSPYSCVVSNSYYSQCL